MRCTIVVFDGFTMLDVVGGYEVLVHVPTVEVEVAATATGVIAADSRRLGLPAYRRLADLASTDILYVPGGPGVVPAMGDAAFLDALARLHATATLTVGICNGVALLAAAGVLAGRTVTTNWGWRERVAALGPTVVAKRWHVDGPVLTGAGVSASIDTALALATILAGEQVARAIRLGIEYYPASPLPGTSADDEDPALRALVLAAEEAAVGRLGEVTAPY
jgi:transcriptional regulator GlxA family with amidase domain